MTKRTNILYAQNCGDEDYDWVQVGAIKGRLTGAIEWDALRLNREPTEVCGKQFRMVFGFMPEENKLYKITVNDITVEEVK